MAFKSILSGAILAVATSVGAASATSVTFDFTDNTQLVSNTGNTAVFSNGGVTLTIGGYDFSGGINGTGTVADATAWNNGIGLRSLVRHDVHFVDGWYDEYLTLSFSTALDVTAASFSYADQHDDWRFYSGALGSQLFEDSGSMSGNGQGNSVYSTLINSASIGTQFLIGTAWNNSQWKLSSLTVELPHTAPIPLPAAGWMLLAGMGGLAAISRRRRKA